MNGWMGKVIRVNLTNETIKIESLNMQDAKHYAGGRGLGTRLYINEVNPNAVPLSAENKLIFMTGPLTGTLAVCAGRYQVVSKSPLTGKIGVCGCGGNFGPELKYAGYDGIIFEGRAKKPLYLYINDDDIELRDACHLWGKGVSETKDELIRETDEDTRIACIGPAGEKLVLFSAILNDESKAVGSSGLGAVMGFKNLKAIAVKGTKIITAAKKNEFIDSCIRARKAIQTKSDVGNMSGRAIAKKYLAGSRGCFGCSAGCEKDLKKYEGWTFGADCGLNDPKAAYEAESLCSELGLDSAAMSEAVACAMELYERGYVSKKRCYKTRKNDRLQGGLRRQACARVL